MAEFQDQEDGGSTTTPVAVEEEVSRDAVYKSVVHGENTRRDPDEDALFCFKIAVTHRKMSFGILAMVNVFWLVLTLALAFSGLDPINDNNIGEVGLVVPDNDFQLRQNAYETAIDESDASLNPGACQGEDVADPITLIVYKGRFDKEGRGNALQKSGLETLEARENAVMEESGWEYRCAKVYSEGYPTCTLNQGDAIDTGFASDFAVADENGCMLPFSPVYFFRKYGDPTFDDIPGTVAKIEASGTDWDSFTDMLHSDFTSSNLRSKILKSTIYAGTPRNELSYYVSTEDKDRINAGFSIDWYTPKYEERERDHLTHWIEENLLEDFEKDVGKTPYRTLFSYPGYDPVSNTVTDDLSLLIIALLLVVGYMILYTGSIFITACGIGQILMSFFGANLLYRYCWPTADGLGYNYFTLFCALSLFIIMGIGADDIFVYWDTWLGSAGHPYKTVAHRMSHVYSHAAAAMLVTSLTTILAFISNLSSPFIGIQTFGVFAGLLVFVNYCAVVTFFPCAVLVYDAHMAHRRYVWEPCWLRLKARWVSLALLKKRRGEAPVAAQDENDQYPAGALGQKKSDAENEEDSEEKEDALPKFFRTTYADFLERRKYWVLGVLMAVWIVFLVFATFLVATPFKTYELLPDTSNFHQFTFISENWFPKSESAINVHVLFGLDHRDPLSLNGVRYQDFSPGESGDPNFAQDFDLDSAAAQLQLVRIADELGNRPRSGLKIDSDFGINRQLQGSKTGSLEDTSGGGATANIQTAYGVQSLLHALMTWENVTEVVSSSDASYKVRDTFDSSCSPCFDTFSITPNIFELDDGYVDPETGLPVADLTLNASSPLNPSCDCVGYFPIPSTVCLDETGELPDDTLYKCTETNDNFVRQMVNFFQAGETQVDENWWDDYIFGEATNVGRFTRLSLYDIQVQTVLRSAESDFVVGLRMAKKWEDWMEDTNSRGDPLKALVYIPNSPGWYISSLLVPSGISNMLVSLALAWCVLTLSTFNWIIASLATFTIGLITTIVLGFLQILGWGLGPLEAILIVIVIGFSVDYTVHLADSYIASDAMDRRGKVRDALGHTGSSVLSGAISTLSASLPLFGAQIIFFFKFGIFVFLTIFLSLVFSLGFFAAVLSAIGPLGTKGHLSNLYGGLVLSAHAHMDELAKEEAAVRAALLDPNADHRDNGSAADVDVLEDPAQSPIRKTQHSDI